MASNLSIHLSILTTIFLPLCLSGVATSSQTHVYSYESIVNSPEYDMLNRKITGHVLINTQTLSGRRKPSGSDGSSHRQLLQIILQLEDSSEPIKGLVIRNELGYVDRLLMPTLYNTTDMRNNFLKAIASIFNYHHTFVPGVEYDTSGRCQTYYGEVENAKSTEVDLNPSRIMIIDKQKVACEPLGQPLDAGLWSVSPILKDKLLTHSWVRYYFDREGSILLNATTYEQHRIAFPLISEKSGKSDITVEGIQRMTYLDESTEIIRSLKGLLATSQDSDLATMARELLGNSYNVEHLALSVPYQKTSLGCGIQSSAFDVEALDSPQVDFSVHLLKQKFKEFEKSMEEPARINSIHAALELIHFLRCLSFNRETLQTLSAVLDFIPSSQREFNRQLKSDWHNQLTDIVINCGTELCQELCRQRLVKISDLAAFSKVGSAAPREVLPIRRYLLDVLWPSIAHFTNPSWRVFRELMALCLHALPTIEKSVQSESNDDSANPYSCLLTVSTLVTKFRGNYGEEKLLFSKVEEMLINIITIEAKTFEDSIHRRQKLLAALAATEKIKASSFSDSIILVVQNVKIPSVLRAVALKTLGNLNFSEDRSQISTVLDKLYGIMESPAPGPHFISKSDELIIKFEAFSALLNLEIPAPEAARIISTFGAKRQWSLLTSCRRLIDNWCSQELLSRAACNCIQYGGPLANDFGVIQRPLRVCSPGLAAGWSGLAGTKSDGEVNIIHGDLLDNRPHFLADYSLQWITGSHGEIRASNLVLSLLNAESEVRLMSFDIYGDQLAALMGSGDNSGTPWLSVGYSLLRGMVPPKQVFSGGFTDIFNLLLTAPDQPTPFLTTTRLPIDVRRYVPLSSGWVLRNDLMGASSIEFSGAISTSVFSQTSTTLVRIRCAIAIENRAIILPLTTYKSDSVAVIGSAVSGFGTAARFEFLIHMEMAGMPESVCMHFQRSRVTPLLQWVGEIKEEATLGRRTHHLHRLPKPNEERNLHYNITRSTRILPVSYYLGELNAVRCRKVGVQNLWN